jgi:hypothetical protein
MIGREAIPAMTVPVMDRAIETPRHVIGVVVETPRAEIATAEIVAIEIEVIVTDTETETTVVRVIDTKKIAVGAKLKKVRGLRPKITCVSFSFV